MSVLLNISGVKLRLITVLLFFSFANIVLAQWGVQSGAGLSHTGYNTYLTVNYQRQAHEISLGPKLLLSDSAVPTEGPWGLRAAYRYTLLKKQRLQAFVQLSYQVTWLDIYNPNQLPNDDRNRIHEAHLAYGFDFIFHPRWRITQSLGVGGYQERLVDLIGERVQRNTGFSAWIGLSVGWWLR